MAVGTLLLAAIAFGLSRISPWLALIVLPFWLFLMAFFRDPERPIPSEADAFVSPADGKVSDITETDHDPLVGGPAVRIGIFLSVFNVHVNRSPCEGRVLSTQYKKGKFINAMDHAKASTDNESNTIVLAEAGGDRPIAVVKQIVGLIARRIVCTIQPGQQVTRGQRIGMIKFGSRTELTIPKWLEPRIEVKVGQVVRGGRDIMARINRPIEKSPGAKAELAKS